MEGPTDDTSDVEEFVRLDFFTEIGKAIAAANSLQGTMKQVMYHIGRVFAPEHWSLMLRDQKSGELTFHLVTGSAANQLIGKKLARGTGVAGWIAENGLPLIVADVTTDKRFDPQMDRIANFETKSIIGVPLVNRARVFGVIELINKINGKAFTPLELKILTVIADFAAIAIEKSYYFRALRAVALLDPLTNLYNRRIVTRYLTRERDRVVRHGTRFSVLLLDVNDFKSINDTYGHVVGDTVLRTVAEIIKESVRKIDIVARYGGDEFLVLLTDSGVEAADAARARILENLAEYNLEANPKIKCSIGTHEADSQNVDNILELVDQAMYRDKARREDPEASYGDMLGHLDEFIESDD